MDIFFEGLNILISTFCVWFSRSFKCFSLPYTIINFFVSFWNCLLNPHQKSLLCDWLISHWLQGKCTKIKLSQAASGMILQNHRRLPVSIFSAKIAAIGLWNGLMKRFSKFLSNFKRSSKIFGFEFFINRETKKCKSYQCMHRKYLFIIIDIIKKDIHFVTQSEHKQKFKPKMQLITLDKRFNFTDHILVCQREWIFFFY